MERKICRAGLPREPESCLECPHQSSAAAPQVTTYQEPSGEGVRVDAALYEGCRPSMHYDPLVGKLICFAPGNDDAAFQAHLLAARHASLP